MSTPLNAGPWARSSRDTTAEAARLQVEAWRRMGASERVRVALELSDAIRAVARAGELRRGSSSGETEGVPTSSEP